MNYCCRLPKRETSRFGRTTDPGRYAQIHRLMHALRADDSQHPAFVLAEFDLVLENVEAKQKAKLLASSSELSKALGPVVERLWGPILVDTRRLCTTTGSTLCALGSVLIIGRLALLAPLYPVLQAAMEILQKVGPQSARGHINFASNGRGGLKVAEGSNVRVEMADILKLAKALALLWAASVAMAWVQLYFMAGVLALAGGSVLVAAGSDDKLAKRIAPAIAPIAAPIAELATGTIRLVSRR